MPKLFKTLNSQSAVRIFLQFSAMSALAAGQPILQLIRENPEFLVVHHFRGWDTIILVATLFILPPVALSFVVYVAGLIQKKVGLIIHSLLLGGLLALILLPIVDKIPSVDGWATLALAAGPAVSLGFFYGRTLFIRQNLGFLALAVPVFLILFIGSGPIRRIIFPDSISVSDSGRTVSSPVVMIIFDEFPTSSLMGLDQKLDCELFPNFCRLADRSTWYRNATTVSGGTLQSVPAIMSGQFPTWSETPSLNDHPNNIFTLLGSSHQVSSLETQTSLCPDELKSESIAGFDKRMDLIVEDIFILYQHIVVPDCWSERLVPVSNKWGGFLESENLPERGVHRKTKMEQFETFVKSLEASEKPNLMVAHILLPHNPYQFFPGGEVYNRRLKVPAQPDGVWGPDKIMVAHSYRRHILQVVATDRLLGNLLDRLEELDLFNEAAIVVTADHGVSFRTGLNRRRFNDGNEADIMGVPLFIKTPGQTAGEISDVYAQTIDIMPTLVSVLGCKIDWVFDGKNLSSETMTDRAVLDFKDQDTQVERKIDPEKLEDMKEIIRWKYELFGDDGGFERLFTYGDDGGLLGKNVADFQVVDHPVLRARILDAQELKDVDLEGVFVPAEFNGTLDGHDGNGRLTLALALNGKIAGVSQTYLDGPSSNIFNWQITTSLEAFHDGSNKAKLFLVSNQTSGVELMQIPLFTPSFVGTNLGGTRISGISESGLFNPNEWGGTPVRWTDGHASWEIPLKTGEKPKILTVKIVSSGPLGADLSISVNGKRLLSQVLPHGAWEAKLPLKSIKLEDHLTVEINSSVFTPAESNPKNNDQRKLGVAVSTLIVK